MDSVFALLKRAREARGLSLADVSDTTFISVQFLEAIEAGKTDILPQAYVRAFIREYSSVVGLDPAEVMHRYDHPGSFQEPAPARPVPVPPAGDSTHKIKTGLPARRAQQAVEPPSSPVPVAHEAPESDVPAQPVAPPVDDTPPEPAPRRDLTDMIQKAALVMGVVVIAIVVWNVTGIERPKTHEIPFQNVIRENEQHAAGPGQRDSSQLSATAQGARTDSLTLVAQTTDSVWIQMIVDGGAPREYLFRPNARASWKAGENFVLTIGNAGAVQFTLNKRNLGTLGKKGTVRQKVELNRQSLTR